jgi:hypothetical protein
MANLSPHFTLREFVKSQTALRRGIGNNPDDTEIKNLIALCENVLEPVREHFKKPVRINSGFRSPDLNSAIGGSKTSQHMTGEAADFEISGVDNLEIAKWIRDQLDFDQLILEFYEPGIPSSGWVHVSYRRPNRRDHFTITKGKKNCDIL